MESAIDYMISIAISALFKQIHPNEVVQTCKMSICASSKNLNSIQVNESKILCEICLNYPKSNTTNVRSRQKYFKMKKGKVIHERIMLPVAWPDKNIKKYSLVMTDRHYHGAYLAVVFQTTPAR